MAINRAPGMLQIPTSSKVIRELIGSLRPWSIGVDPGETVGVSIHGKDRGEIGIKERYEDRWLTLSLEPTRALDEFSCFCTRAHKDGVVPTLYIEEYRIYPEKLQAHSGKTIPTAENIGAFKELARRLRCNVIEQPASIKETTAAILRARGIPLIGSSRHAKDAELHMWYPILSKKYKKPTGGRKS